MVLSDIKKETSSPVSLLNTAISKEGGLSFSELLKGKERVDDKIIQNGQLVLRLKDEKIPTKLESLELDPKITTLMTPKELKVLIKEAKEFLKNKIVQSKGFTKAEINALPKTLNGLVKVAKKIGIDISKITLEEVKGFVQTNTKTITSKKSPSSQIKIEPKQKRQQHSVSQIKIEPKQKRQQHSVSQIKQGSREETGIQNEIPITGKIKKTKIDTLKPQKIEAADKSLKLTKKETVKEQVKQEQTPLFKAQNSVAAITTQQIVDAKVSHLFSQKTQKQKADDTLKLLLRGEKVSKKDISLTASLSTAKVIAPHATDTTDKSLESLLKKNTKDTDDTPLKTDGMHIAKADSFEVKIHEAKQMVKYLSQDVKSAIEDYKSPFTRVKVQLHPQKLGEIDLTVVQRGKNLHINLSSNNAAINTLAMNANDLKVQLNNNGINNASFNFNSNAQSDNSQTGQQQRQQQQQADKEYNYFDSHEGQEEQVNSLEIIVPHYA